MPFLLFLAACGDLGGLPDIDGDAQNARDCARVDGAVYAGAAEVENGIDDDCDGAIDEGTAAVDDDGDGYADREGDCDDADPGVFPGADELENNADDDCDGTTDEGTAAFDDDGDGVSDNDGDCDDADPARSPLYAEACDGVDDDCDLVVDDGFDLDADGVTECGGDADDLDPTVYPGADEMCDGVDNDQDSVLDEGCDGDGDGFTVMESQGEGDTDGDCDDARADVHPGAPETCDEADNDCDGLVDGRDDVADDPDHDTYSCEHDCDEQDAAIHVAALEVSDDRDNDCDGEVDEGLDLDGDGADGAASGGPDCDDLQSDVRPGAEEACNGQDDDCDDEVDEGHDADADGWTTCDGDCDDRDASQYPGNLEDLNARDDNCDGLVDEDVGLIVAAELDVQVAPDGSKSVRLPLPSGEYDSWEVLVLPTAVMDNGDGFCGWTSDWSESGGVVEVTVDVADCKDRTDELQGSSQGYGLQLDVILVVDASADVELLSSGIRTGGTDPGYGESAALSLSSSGGDTFSACAWDQRDEGGDRDWDFHIDCMDTTASLQAAAEVDDCRDTGWVGATALIAAGFDNLTVAKQSFELEVSDDGVLATLSHTLDSSLGDDHLTLLNLLKIGTGDCKDNLDIDMVRSTSASETTIETRTGGTGSQWAGNLLMLDGRFLYWSNGLSTY